MNQTMRMKGIVRQLFNTNKSLGYHSPKCVCGKPGTNGFISHLENNQLVGMIFCGDQVCYRKMLAGYVCICSICGSKWKNVVISIPINILRPVDITNSEDLTDVKSITNATDSITTVCHITVCSEKCSDSIQNNEDFFMDPIMPYFSDGKDCSKCHRRDAELMACGTCREIRYCGAACQKADWAAHKIVCDLYKANPR